MSTTTTIKTFDLSGTKDGKITVSVISEPYGAKSDSVVSVGIALQGGEPDWKVHLPKENIDEVILAIQEAKKSL